MRTTKEGWALVLGLVWGASFVGATGLDGFDSPAGWTPSFDSGSWVSVSTAAGQTGSAMALDFKLGSGKWAGVTMSRMSPVDFSFLGANAVRFFYKAVSRRNTIEFKLSDSDSLDPGQCTKAVLKFPAVADGLWHEVIAPVKSFVTWKDTGLGGDTNSAVFDWNAVSHVSYGVSMDGGTPGADTLRFDDFSFYKLDAPVPLVNGFENFVDNCWVTNDCQNDRPSPQSSIAFDVLQPRYGSSMIVSTQAAPGSGTHSREIRYTLNGGGFFGIAEALEGVSVLPTDQIEFYAKGAVGGEPFHVQVKSSNQSVSPYATVETLPFPLTTSWQKFSIPFSSFLSDPTGGGDLDLDNLSEVIFLFEHLGADKSGRVYVDDIRLVRPGGTPLGSVVKSWDDFSGDKAGYKEYVRDTPLRNATLRFSFDQDESINGAGNKVARLDYSFSAGGDVPYAVVERGVGLNFLAEPNIRLRYKGTRGKSNIELKLTDADGTVFRKTLVNASYTGGQWRTVTIPLEEFSFLSDGSDKKLDLNQIAGVGLFLTPGGTEAGDLILDSLEIVKPEDVTHTQVGKLLSRVTTPDNPFSPNNDGLKDLFTVRYILTDAARVTFEVYNLQGLSVKTVDVGSALMGENQFTWDGRDDNGRHLVNGLYFFTLKADSDFSGDQIFRQVVGIIR